MVPSVASARRTQHLALPRRLAILTAAMSLLLLLGATEVGLSWSQRSRLEDLRLEAVALANTLGALLSRQAPTGNPEALALGLRGWSRHRFIETEAWAYVGTGDSLTQVAQSDRAAPRPPDSLAHAAMNERATEVGYYTENGGGWQVDVPLGGPKPYGVLDVRVSAERLATWANTERKRAYALAVVAALLVSLGVAALTSRWVGQPLGSLTQAMAAAHGGARGAPAAPQVGPPEFREVAGRYNALRDALAERERESEARTALQALEEQARSLDRLAMMEETGASFAHEIGTPLNTVRGHLQLLRHDLAGSGDQGATARVDLLLGQVDRVASIVRAGLERGAWPAPRLEVADLKAIAQRMLQFLEPSLNSARVTAVIDPASTPALARCDQGMVEQVLLNLIKNAIEALPPGGMVSIRSGREGDHVYVDVADDGPGLAPEAQIHLFNPFATTKGPAGTGLGLAVSRRLARTQGGDLVFIPAAKGTRWRISLPAEGTA